MTGQRLDRWLWFARIVKTRSLAAKLISGGKIRLNRERVEKSSRIVQPNDVITAVIHKRVMILKVLAEGSRRGPAAEARLLYENLAPQPVASRQAQAEAGLGRRAGRPTKRDKRRIEAFLGKHET